jgi:hypothetical protein
MDNKQLGIAVAIITIALTIPPVLLGILEYAQNKEKRELEKELTRLSIQELKARISNAA